MNHSTFAIQTFVPKQVLLSDGRFLDRETFFSWMWEEFGSDDGLVGIHEGSSVLDEDDCADWVIDNDLPPENRDWVADQTENQTEFYFMARSEAELAVTELEKLSFQSPLHLVEHVPQDWDANWRASFLATEGGIAIEPFWRIIPPWVTPPSPDHVYLKINPGIGFGTGTHETTQLCLKQIGSLFKNNPSQFSPILDFGSGSGILAIGAALLGATLDAVEIDSLAIDNAKENAELNSVSDKIHFHSDLGMLSQKKYAVILANILRPTLIQFSEELCNL